jgi:hypothetical protein
MGLFNFFKKDEHDEQKSAYTKAEVSELILTALNVLTDDTNTIHDAKKLIRSKGYNEDETAVIVHKANELYLKHFKNKKPNTFESNQEDPRALNPEEANKLKQLTLKILCKDKNALDEAKTLLNVKGYNDEEAMLILYKTKELYDKHLDVKESEHTSKEKIQTGPRKTINELYAEKGQKTLRDKVNKIK